MKRNFCFIYIIFLIFLFTVCTRYTFLTEDQWNELYGDKNNSGSGRTSNLVAHWEFNDTPDNFQDRVNYIGLTYINPPDLPGPPYPYMPTIDNLSRGITNRCAHVWQNLNDGLAGSAPNYSNYIWGTVNSYLDLSNDFSIAFCINLERLPDSTAGYPMTIINNVGSGGTGYSIDIIPSTKQFVFNMYSGGSIYTAFSYEPLSTNVWYYVVCTYNSNIKQAGIHVYNFITGTGSSYYFPFPSIGNVYESSAVFTLGGILNSIGSNDDFNRNMEGYLDELKIYNIALSESQVNTYFTQYSSITFTRTVSGSNEMDTNYIYSNLAMSNENYYNNVSYVSNYNDLRYLKSIDKGDNWYGKKIITDPYNILYQSIASRGSNICISYTTINNELKFAVSKDSGNNWQVLSSTIVNAGFETSVALTDNYAYISYTDISGYDLNYAVIDLNNLPSVNAYIVDDGSSSSFGTYNSITVDESNIIYIAYRGLNDYLYLARNEGYGWTYTNLHYYITEAVDPWDISIYADNDIIGISYFTYYNGFLNFVYSTDNGATWFNEIPDSTSSNVGWNTKLAVSGSERFISYYDHALGLFKYARDYGSAGTWVQNVIDYGVAGQEFYPAMTVDDDYIYYFYNRERHLYFKRNIR
ncbi:MAG: LamG domain-containing protein [Spirochaetes bacterium]|nr:LamG domain-containing protein [Spirochaetota bacterium]